MIASLGSAQVRESALLEIKVLEGDGDRHSIGSRAYKGISVLVSDEEGVPVPNARVVFRMPDTGPGGRFANGLPEEVSTTDAQGRTSVWGVQWNGVPGESRISIFASRGKARAGTTASVTLTGQPAVKAAAFPEATFAVEVARPKPLPLAPRRRLEPRPPEQQSGAAVHPTPVAKRPSVTLTRTDRAEEAIPGPRSKWLLIALGVGGAVGGGMLYRMLQQKAASAGTAAPATVINPLPTRPAIGNPTITIGRP